MQRFQAFFATVAIAALTLAGCTTTGPTRAERLALYQTYAGAPVDKIRYSDPLGWEELDDEYIVITMRPREQYLMRLAGMCLSGISSSPVLTISSITGYITPRLDKVSLAGAPMGCRIQEIRPIDVAGLKAALAAQASGT